MFLSSQTKTRYRVVNRRKFIISSTLTILFLAAMMYTVALGVRAGVVWATEVMAVEPEIVLTEEIAENVEVQPKPISYQYSMGDISIDTEDKDQFIEELETLLTESIQRNDALENKYQLLNQNIKQVTKEDIRIYKEYDYVLDYNSSDFTVDDIKMVEKLCKEYGNIVNPHLWFALVELESAYRSNTKNSKSSASGWGQVIKGTGRYIYENKLKLGTYNHAKMGISKEVNARISIYYLSDLINETKSVNRALIRYNGGELGARYASIVSSKLKKNSNLTLKQVQTFADKGIKQSATAL